MLTSIDVKFIFDSACLGLNILQIADVPLQIVFLLLYHIFSYYFT